MPDSKVSQMPLATSVADADLVPIVQGGVNKRAPASLVKGTTDAQLRDRSTHTGTQLAETISDLDTAVAAALPIATDSVLGVVMIGAGLEINGAGLLDTMSQKEAYWNWVAAAGTTPGTGRLQSDNADWAAATQTLYFNKTTKPGTDVSAYFPKLAAGDTVVLQERGVATNYVRFVVSGLPVLTGNIWTVPVSAFRSGGVEPNNNAEVMASFTYASDGGGGSGVTNLDYTASTRLLTSDTGTDVTLPLVTSTDAGLAPASGGGTSNYLRADGTWVAPAAALSTNAAVTAGTNAQGQGVLTSDFNVITTAAANPSGVTLPAASAGKRVVIVNRGANPINIYPATGTTINTLAINTSIALPATAVMEFYGESATSWETDAISLTSGVSGVLAVANGGTGNTTNSATTLTTSRTIGGSSFNGSANITSFPAPGAIGGTTPSTGVFTTLEARSATSLLLGTAGSAVGSVGFRNATSGSITLQPPTGALGTAVLTVPALTGTLSTRIASGTAALGTSAIASGASATLVTVAAAGVLTTDVIQWGFSGDPSGVTGYSGATVAGRLTITAYPTAGNVNFLVSNPTAGPITPGALTLNWNVTR